MKRHIVMLALCMAGSLHAASSSITEPSDYTPFGIVGIGINFPPEPAPTAALALWGNIAARGIQPLTDDAGKLLADGKIQLLDCSKNPAVVTDTILAGSPVQVFLPNGKLCFLTYAINDAGDGVKYVVQRPSGVQREFEPAEGDTNARISPDGRRLVIFDSGNLNLYDLDAPADQAPVLLSPGGTIPRAVAFHEQHMDNDRQLLRVAILGYNRKVQLWDNGVLTQVMSADHPTGVSHNVTHAYYGVTFSPGGDLYVTGNNVIWKYDCKQKETKTLGAYSANETSRAIMSPIASALNRSGAIMAIADPIWGLLFYYLSTQANIGSKVGGGVGLGGTGVKIVSFDTCEDGDNRYVQSFSGRDNKSLDSVVQLYTQLTPDLPPQQFEEDEDSRVIKVAKQRAEPAPGHGCVTQ